MEESKLKELLEELRLSKTGIGWTIKGNEPMDTVEAIIRKHLNHSNALSHIAILEAKIFTYEEIIKKSNFAPMLEKKIPHVPIEETQK